MSSVVDERVVQMSFDNEQFEKGVSQTIGSLRELDNTLDETSNGKYFEKMESGIKNVQLAFSVSTGIMIGALSRIGSEIVSIGLKLKNYLTSGLTSGFQEYETQMDATQTILANVKDEGKGIEDVTLALDELNTYADKTIYNFTEMTRNIGMFTAAGANLDTSVSTIKGLANAAALVGANATTAARAWYQVSQAMAAGTFKLIDWRSLEISNIAGEGFKTVLTEVARKDGLAVAKMIDQGTALRETLNKNWLTADRFTEGMKILSGELDRMAMISMGYTVEQAKKLEAIANEAVDAATKVKTFGQLMQTVNEAIGSGWAVTFRTIIGDFTKARKFYTRISNTLNNLIDKAATYRNKFVDIVWNGVGLQGGGSPADDLKETLDNVLAVISTFVGAARAGFDNIFPWERMRDGLKKLTGTIKDATSAMVINDRQTDTFVTEDGEEVLAMSAKEKEERSNLFDLDVVNDNIKNLIRIFRGLFAGIDIVWTTIKGVISFIFEQIHGLNTFFGDLKDNNLSFIESLANILDKVTKLRDIMVKLDLIPNVLRLIKKSIIDIITTNPLLNSMVNLVAFAISCIVNLNTKLKELNLSPFTIIVGIIRTITTGIAALVNLIGSLFDEIGKKISGNESFSFLEFLGQKITSLIKIFDALGKGTISLGDIFEECKKKVIDFYNTLKDDPKVKIIATIGAIVGGIALLITIFKKVSDFLRHANPIGLITDSLGKFSSSASSFGTTALLNTLGDAILKFTISIIALAVAFEKMPNSMMPAITVIGAIVAVLLLLVSAFRKISDTLSLGKGNPVELFKQALSKMATSAMSFLKMMGVMLMLGTFADAVVKIAASLVALASINPTALTKASISMVVLIGALGAVVAVIQYYAQGLTGKNALGLLAIVPVIASIGLVVKILSSALTEMSKLNPSSLLASVVSLSAIIAVIGTVITVFEQEARASKNVSKAILSISAMFLALSVGMGIIISASSLIKNTTQINAIIVSMISVMSMVSLVLIEVTMLMTYIKEKNITDTRITQALGVLGIIAASLAATSLAFAVSGGILAHSGATMEQMGALLLTMAMVSISAIGVILLISNAEISIASAAAASITMVSIASTLVIIASALAVLNGVKIDMGIVEALGALIAIVGLITVVLGILAAVGAEGITEIVAAAFVALAAYFIAIGGMVYLISEAILNFQQAAKNMFDAFLYIGDKENAQKVLDAITNITNFLFNAAPALKDLFIALGRTYVTVVSGFLEGFTSGIGGFVTAFGNTVLTILNQIASWVSQNTPAIQSTLVNVFKAIMMIALVALNVAFFDILPTILFFLMNIMTQILGFIVGLIVDLGAAVNKMWGDLWAAILGEDNPLTQYFRDQEQLWKDARDTLDTVVQDMVSFLNGLTDAVMNGMLLVNDMFGYFSDASTEVADTVTTNNEEIMDSNDALTENIEGNTEATVSYYEAQANASSESTGIQIGNFLNLSDVIGNGTENLFGGLSGLSLDFFNLQSDNAEAYYGGQLSLQNGYEVDSINSTNKYLDKQSAIWNDYYGSSGDAAADYYTAMAEVKKAADKEDAANVQYWTTKMNEAKITLKDQGISSADLFSDNFDVDAAGNIISKAAKPVYDTWASLGADLSTLWSSYEPGEVDTSAYAADYKSPSKVMDSGTDTSKLQNELNDRNSMIEKADSEIQPKDLTPTIDLDSLKNEVNQANGIMTGSLLAAQNAAIGDYINTDSELNPFLKDRWQNVYNFTQNNYSPKALSRIDIYRQTQNQLRLSRGM